ncbi:hypothetical protein [Salinactinospora qingdaonensis]|uniref:Uncharacterized protein n=1 Tax=Salinactinospora qingdaonensis TaxID=702744 RepID=A0ABP7FN42_9ACTN
MKIEEPLTIARRIAAATAIAAFATFSVTACNDGGGEGADSGESPTAEETTAEETTAE